MTATGPAGGRPGRTDERPTRAAIYGLTILEERFDDDTVYHRPVGGTARQRRQWQRMHRCNLDAGCTV